MKKSMLLITLVVMLFAATAMAAPAVVPGFQHADGTYRGGYIDPTQIEVQFTLKDNQFTEIRYRALGYRGTDYLKSEDEAIKGVTGQYNEIAEYLIGKDVSALKDLYFPENITKDTDTFTAATLRANKLISAINDGLNRGLYNLPKE